ncbi:DNA primase regulatory subunit PriL [Candidatus Bathyarchaeota archaeon]|nr:MAG: DNA primase regulatory subunit PriL [Candidatus Bathyarchaeota archaeon]
MISEREAAKYPFLKGAVSLVETLSLKVDDLADPSYSRVLDRGEQRVSEAILEGIVSASLGDALTEMLSFPVAVMFVTVVGDRFLDRRYALAEAVRVYELLKGESETRIARMAREEFGWNLRLIRRELDGQIYRFELHFTDYLRNAASFHEDKWKLVNRVMRDGYVLLTRVEAARLIQVEVEDLIRKRVSKHGRIALPDAVQERVDRVAKLFEEHRARIGGEELPSEVVSDAFPPCIRHAFEGLMSGRRASHMERFALTSFLVNAGMDLDRIVQLFVSVTDFDEQLTRYQIEHIAGLRGSRTRYTPPTCATMRTHGVCYNPDRLCKRIKHPLTYYRIKIRDFKKKGEGRPAE